MPRIAIRGLESADCNVMSKTLGNEWRFNLSPMQPKPSGYLTTS